MSLFGVRWAGLELDKEMYLLRLLLPLISLAKASKQVGREGKLRRRKRQRQAEAASTGINGGTTPTLGIYTTTNIPSHNT
jgi:hypothetical protein